MLPQALGGELSQERKAAWADFAKNYRAALAADGRPDAERQAAQVCQLPQNNDLLCDLKVLLGRKRKRIKMENVFCRNITPPVARTDMYVLFVQPIAADVGPCPP